jgi:hypothetical protein
MDGEQYFANMSAMFGLQATEKKCSGGFAHIDKR